MKALLKKTFVKFYFFFYFFIGRFFVSKNSVRILILHDVRDDQIDSFKELIQNLNGFFQFISPSELERFLDGKIELKRPGLLLTFDDGFLSSKKVADEILDPLGIKSLFFLCSNFIEVDKSKASEFYHQNFFPRGTPLFPFGPEYFSLSKSEIKELLSSGNLIGGHTQNHSRLSLIEKEESFKTEIEISKEEIQSIINENIEHFAFPFGDLGSIDSRSFPWIKRNYRYCYSGVRGQNAPGDHYILKRDAIDLRDDTLYNLGLCVGGLDFFYRKKRKSLKQMANTNA